MNNLYTIGEVLDNIKIGEYAVSQDDKDKGSLFSIDQDGWIFGVYPHRKYKRYGINFKFQDGISEKRWEIRKIDEYFLSEIEGLEFVD